MSDGDSPVKNAPVDENPVKKAFHWHPRGLRGGDDDSAAAAEEHDEQAQLIATPPMPPLDVKNAYTSLAQRTWDVKMPPAKMHVVKGRLVPTVSGTVGALVRQKKRRISLDILLKEGEDVAMLDEDRKRKIQDLLTDDSVEPTGEEELLEGEIAAFRVLKEADEHHEHDDSSAEGETGPDTDGWIQKHMNALDGVEIQKTSHSHCDVKIGHGNDTRVRQINFQSEKEMMSFYHVFEKLKTLQRKRAEKRVREFRSSAMQGSSQILLLVEIVSGMRLPVADASTLDPYVIVRLGSKEVHRTKPIYNTVNPIWTISNGSLFLLSTTPKTFFAAAAGLTLIVKDCNAMGKDDILGKVVVEQNRLLRGKGERKEYKLVDVGPQHRKHPGKLVLRFRKATAQDVKFMNRLWTVQNSQTVGAGIYGGVQKAITMGVYGETQKDKAVGVYADETLLPPKVTPTSMFKREHKGYGDKKEMRVKPGPDPDRPAETEWMTEAQIEAECDKPSKEWFEVGSGQIGKLYVEILGCDNLPNMDKGTIGGGKTDAFVSIVYEDCIVNTEVVNDVLSPRWMPWTQRAFVFRMMHPASQLMVGVLDYNSAPMADHDPIGRVAIAMTNFHIDADYTLYYDLYTSAIVSKHEATGQIKLRLRIEILNSRQCLAESTRPPPQLYITVATLRDYRIAKFVLEGKYDVNKFDMDLLAGYVEELQEYQSLIPLLQQAAFTVLFWQGTFPISIRVPQCPALASGENRRLWDRVTKSVTIRLPLHSLTAFIGGILLAEDFTLLLAFILFGIAWILIASAGYLHRHPSPWRQRRSFLEVLRWLVTDTRVPMQSIQPYQNEEAIKQYLAEKEEVEKKRKEEAEKKAQEAQLHKETKAEMGDAEAGGEVEMDTKVQGFGVQINPWAPILFPVQQHLEMACTYVRIARSYVTWEETFGAFWMVVASILSGLVLLFVPRAFILRWLFRIVVWVVFGPWMKLVDIFYIKKPRSTEEEQKAAEARLKAKYKAFLESAREKQTEREERMKLKDMKRYMFGEYILTVPRFKQARYVDFPLDASEAAPCEAGTSSDVEVACRKFGQHLTGVMIPERETDEVLEKTSLPEIKVGNYSNADQEYSKKHD